MEIGKLIISVDSSAVTKAADELSRLNAEIEKLLAVINIAEANAFDAEKTLKEAIDMIQKVQVRVVLHG